MIDMEHPITMGLSDAYLIERRSGHFIHEQIITYHKVDLFHDLTPLVNDKHQKEILVEFQPLKTCNQFKNCWECLTHETDFNCIWCPGLEKCSDNGIDRNYQVRKINLKI